MITEKRAIKKESERFLTRGLQEIPEEIEEEALSKETKATRFPPVVSKSINIFKSRCTQESDSFCVPTQRTIFSRRHEGPFMITQRSYIGAPKTQALPDGYKLGPRKGMLEKQSHPHSESF